MNIFYLDRDVVKCAEMHNDKHCVKMILEYAQLLSTAHRVLDGHERVVLSQSGRKKKTWELPDLERDTILYSATHLNHPSAKWARDSARNYRWLYELFCALCDEYTYRYDKIHLTDTKLRKLLSELPANIKDKPFEEPWRAMPDEVKIGNDSLASYRNYYINSKTHLASWKKRPTPEWYIANI